MKKLVAVLLLCLASCDAQHSNYPYHSTIPPTIPNNTLLGNISGSAAAPTAQTLTAFGIYAQPQILRASDYGVSPSNSATTNDTGFSALKTAMQASSTNIWEVVFAPGTYQYTNNRWLFGVQNVIIDAYGASFENTNSSVNGIDASEFNNRDYFDNGGDNPCCTSNANYATGDLINTASAAATSVTTTTAAAAGNYTVGQRVLIYGYDQQQLGYPPNMRFFEEKVVASTNASTGVVELTAPLQNSYDSRWWDTANYGGITGFLAGAPRILSLERTQMTVSKLIWIRGATFLANPVHSSFSTLLLTADLVIYEDVTAPAFGGAMDTRVYVIRSTFLGNGGSGNVCDKFVDKCVIEDSTFYPYNNLSFADGSGTNSMEFVRDTFYGTVEASPRSFTMLDSDITPVASTFAGMGTTGTFPVRSVAIGSTRIHNTGQTYGWANVGSPGNTFTVGSVSGTTLLMTWNSTAVTVADQIEYGMELTDTTQGCTATVTGIYLTGGNTLNITQTGCSSPQAGDTIDYYDVMVASDMGGSAIIGGTQVPFWRGPPGPSHR